MERARALALLARLHDAQGSFYAGGPDAPLRALLADAAGASSPRRRSGCIRAR